MLVISVSKCGNDDINYILLFDERLMRTFFNLKSAGFSFRIIIAFPSYSVVVPFDNTSTVTADISLIISFNAVVSAPSLCK